MDVPYCGLAPIPAELIWRWNLDPALMLSLASLAMLHAWVLRRAGEWNRKAMWFGVAWCLLAALFLSPLCALTSALFSARVGHHVVLVAAVAPLLVLALPDVMRAMRLSAATLAGLGLVHGVVLWFWHAPAPYSWAIASHGIFWLMELTLLGSALALWLAVLSPRAAFGAAVVALLATVIQTGLLGAVITFARAPLYVPHFATTEPWGLTALADQQLAGLIMWVPSVIPYLAVALALLGRQLDHIGAATTDGRP